MPELIQFNLTITEPPPQWDAAPPFHLPKWAEPMIVISILCGAMYMTRRRNFSILSPKSRHQGGWLDDQDSDSADSFDELLRDDDSSTSSFTSPKHPSKRRRCCGCVVSTPNSSRFAHYPHSRLLAKFPFLIEMFYWSFTLGSYKSTKIIAQALFPKTIIDVSLAHGLSILEFEQFSALSFLFPWKEIDVQRWFIDLHPTALTVLNQAYALIHIPGTVGFIAWYYYIAPSHSTFATIRRTLTLINYFAFLTFTAYPCMPPRLLPPEYGFVDSVRHDNATSIWMSGDYVNSLAAMPSMHFGYAFVIGCTLLYHSGLLRFSLEKGESRKSLAWKIIYVLFSISYPMFILVTIVATANHYWLDALVATLVTCAAFLCNEIFYALLPLEDLLLWVLRLDKPVPTTGERFRQRGGRI